ncbi:MAG TPA: hypothetical protein VEC99_04830 [Clostridia bacterium]|nr:hypothetical protein [Clostridia bacterium]
MTQLSAMTSQLLPMAEKQLEEVVGLMEKNNRITAELMSKAIAAAQTPVIAESQAKWTEFWTSL